MSDAERNGPRTATKSWAGPSFAIGETTCATAATADDEEGVSYCGDVSSVSPDGSYGQTDCPGQYVVEFSGGLDRIDSFDDGWGDTLPSTQAACEHAHAYVTAWHRVNGVWDDLGATDHQTGVWDNGECYFPNRKRSRPGSTLG